MWRIPGWGGLGRADQKHLGGMGVRKRLYNCRVFIYEKKRSQGALEATEEKFLFGRDHVAQKTTLKGRGAEPSGRKGSGNSGRRKRHRSA